MDDGTAVPLTLPVALTWGNKFPIARDPALFLLLPSKPEGPPLKKCRGWGGGKTLTLLQLALRRGEIFSSLTSYFKFCLCKVWALFFLFLFFKGNEMEFEGNASLIPLLHVLPGACPRASASSSINSLAKYSVLSLGSGGDTKQLQRRTQRLQWPFSVWGQPCSKNIAYQLLTQIPLFFFFSGTIDHSDFSLPCLSRQYPC